VNKKLLIVIISLLSTIVYANEAIDAIEMAKMYEKQGDIQKAMEQYKKAALMMAKPKKNYIQNKNIVTFGKNSIKSYGNEKTDRTVKQIIYSEFDIEPYRINYLLPVTYDSKDHTVHDNYKIRDDFETKFQLSFKKRLFENIFGLQDKLYVAYTQTSWWQTSAASSPFRETNYEPEMFLDIPYGKKQSILKSYRVGLVHQSNGKLSTSRSWNRAYISGVFQYSGIFFEPKVWYRFKEHTKVNATDFSGDDNPDILDYLGYGEITISYPYKEYIFSSKIRKKSIQLDWTFPIFGLTDVYGYLQYFNGYGESLVDYNEKVNKIGLGFAITR